jgi:putative solute:sodium symporter small subunit
MMEYWKKNQRLIAVLLTIWAVVSYGFAIFGARLLHGIKLGSVPMSFWWAQQGSMFVFVVLIFVYARRMDKLDREYGVGEDE